MRVATLLGGLAGLALLACGEPTAPVRSELLIADARQETVRLANLTRESVYYFVIERNFSALALIQICTEPATCPRVVARATLEIDYADIAGYEVGAEEAVVLHWRLVPAAGGGFRADSVRALVTRLN